jgi:hypothetical protein
MIDIVFFVGLKIYMDTPYFNGKETSASSPTEIRQIEEKDGTIYTKLYLDG